MDKNTRVEIHPCTDLWMMGARFGNVVRVKGAKALVKLDRYRRAVWFLIDDLKEV